MADIEFISKAPEMILEEMIAEYQRLAGVKLQPADAEMILINCMAYREVILRGGMENLMRQNFVQYATGENLDNWGALWGTGREQGETDDEYRVRILSVAKGTIGTKAAYFARIKAVPGVSDILIIQKFEESILPPGYVRLIPIMETTSANMVSGGGVHDAALERSVLESITAKDFGIVGPVFVFQAAVPVPVSGSVEVRQVYGSTDEQVKRNVALKIEEYFGEISKTFSGKFGVFDLERKVLEAEGVSRVTRMDFFDIPVTDTGEFYSQGNVIVNLNK
ncbi:MAG: baseplate J/gp47 family protein [Culturomica sp.]|jgi:hypothetical protein|nr:baseplate J/gp47 family protein [Culturomica sp.]